MKAPLDKKTQAPQQQITPPNIRELRFTIRGTAPLVVAAFSAKAQAAIRAKHEAGSTAKSKGQKREARDFSEDCRQALHVAAEGWHGVNATAIKLALVSACRTVNYKMTMAKLGLFVVADGFDRVSGVPLLRIHAPAPYEELVTGPPAYEETVVPTRNESGVFDLRARPMWREWELRFAIKFDADMFTASDVTNLLARAGGQVGIGEGRPDSKDSCGCGWGTFAIAG
jgi:hypothetical protein